MSLSSVSLNPTSLLGGNTSRATVTLSANAPGSGIVVTLGSNNADAEVPFTVTVPAGLRAASFNVTTMAVSASVHATITGTYNGVARSASLAITAAAPTPLPPGTAPTPTYEDDFNLGKLSTDWIVSNWGAPGVGVFSPMAIDMSQGCLCLKLTQTSTSSVGGELQLNKLFGYGTYEFVMRASSTSATKGGAGSAVSGQISAVWNYLPDATYNSITELDMPEIEGDKPNQLSFTVWRNGTRDDYQAVAFNAPEASFHSYKFQWFAGSLKIFVDGVMVQTFTSNIPTQAAYPMINHWGTNNTGWGGNATPGVTRYMYVSGFRFWAGVAV